VARWGDWSFGVARAAGIFQGPLRAAVHRLKYNDLKELATPLGALLANRMIPDGLLIGRSYEAIVALPLHPARERERGYNQAHLLAAAVAEMTGIPLLPMGILTRTQRTDPQARLSLRARRAAITPEMFTLTQPNTVTGKSLLLVDDVFTTGTTVNACATTLIQAGAASVDVATLAAGG
jgi:ComF family protein